MAKSQFRKLVEDNEKKQRLQEMTDNDLLIKVHERLSAIETHLKDMNGRLVKHDNQLTSECPKKHSDVDTRINNLSTEFKIQAIKLSLIIGGITFILTILGTKLVNALLN